MTQNGGTRGGTFHGKMDRCRGSQGWTTACSRTPERDGKDLTVEIAYTEQRENHGTMILHGVSYSAYALRYGSYCRYEIAPSNQS